MNAVRWLDRKIAGFFGGTRNIKLAQGLEIVLVVLHKRLTGHFSKKYPETDNKFAENLATAVLNELFPRTKPGRDTPPGRASRLRGPDERVHSILPGR